MVDEEEDLLLAAAAVCVVNVQKRKRRYSNRRWWCKEWLLKRNQYSHINLLEELRLYPDDWRNYLRMNEQTYLELLNLVTPLIKRSDTNMRSAISPHERTLHVFSNYDHDTQPI